MWKCLTALCLLVGLPAAAADQPEPAHILTFGNEDRVHCRIRSLGEGKVTFRRLVAPKQTVSADVKDLVLISSGAEAGEPDRTKADLLELWDGSLLFGRFLGMTKQSIAFEIQDAGKVRLPLAGAASITRAGFTPPESLPEGRGHVVCTKKGDVLVGELAAQDGNVVVVDNKAFKLRVKHSQIMSIHFPQPQPPESGPRAPDQASKRKLSVVGLAGGGVLAGTDLAIKDGRTFLTLAGDQRVSVPLKSVIEITFTGEPGLVGARQVLVWGAFADQGQELPRTVAALKQQIPKRWRIVQSLSREFDDAFRKELRRTRTLLIPEMEKWSSSGAGARAGKLKSLAGPLLRRGGNVVILGATSSHVKFFRDAGLIDVRQQGATSDNSQVALTAKGKWLGKGLGDTFKATNSTMCYKIGSTMKAHLLAGSGGKGPCVARRVGRGWVILMGMDYYASNAGTARMLANAVTRR